MKWMLITVISITLPLWVNARAAKAFQTESEEPHVIVTTNADGAGGEPFVWVVGNGEGDGEVAHAFAMAGEPKDGRSTATRAFVRVEGSSEDAKNRPWLGISITEVPEALRTHLALEGGIMVGNVVKDSPADVAGLKQYDIVTAIDGAAVEGEAGGAVSLLREHKPGDTVNLSVIRDGRDQVIRVTLGSWADNNLEWKFMQTPDTEVIDRVRTRGKIIRKDDKGNYVVEDLGDIGNVPDLPKDVLKWIPESGEVAISVTVDNGEKTTQATRERDGVTLSVTRVGDGPITATRTDEDGQESTATYDTPEALEAADADAYELFERIDSATVVTLPGDGGGAYAFNFQLDGEDLKAHAEAWKEKAEEWHAQFEANFADAREAYEQAMKQWHEQADQLKQQGLPDTHWMELMPLFGDEDAALPHLMLRHMGKPKHTFELLADGGIEVRIRRGDSELLRKFADEEDLAERDPQLYAKYVKLMEADSDKE